MAKKTVAFRESFNELMDSLNGEFPEGGEMMRELHAQGSALEENLLRIQGMLQVLEEMVDES